MSWFSKNYEKAALGGAAVIALGLCYLGWSKRSGVDEDFANDLKGSGNNNTAVASADLIPKAAQSMKLDRVWTQALYNERPVDLFTGIPLFIKSSEPEKPVDLLAPSATPVHPPIPNTWWIEHRLSPEFADSANRDPDGDGYSNKEEYLAKTDPNNAKSIPALIAKLMYVKDESLAWVLRPGPGDGGKFPFKYEDSKRQDNKVTAGEPVAPGGLFFPKGVMKDRFKLLGHAIRREISKSTKVEIEVTIVRIEDQRPNKKGDVYEIPSPLQEERKNEHLQYDRTAVLSLEAIGLSGKEFKVEERTTFALPPNAPKKEYLLKKVTPASITVEYTDSEGKTKTLEITKGSLSQPAE
jgi:hypothetical protein